MQQKTNIVFIGNGGRSTLTTLRTVIDRVLVIPSYQRPYAWSEDHIEDLFTTIKESFENDQNLSDGKHPAFFGSVIFSSTQDENKYRVIDGQQRVTTFLLVLRVIQDKLDQDAKRMLDKLHNLDHTLDKMDKKGDIKKAKDIFGNRMKLEKEHEKISNLIKKIQNILQKTNISREKAISKTEIAKMESEYIKYITGANFKGSKDFEKNKEKISNHINNIIDDMSLDSSDENKKYCYIVEYILNMVKFCLLFISGKHSEEYAIDVFNTLNTTGEPLTGFEFFKSRIIQIGQNSGKLKDIETGLSEIESAIKKHKPQRKDIIVQTGKLLLYLAVHRGDYKKENLSDKKLKKQIAYIKNALNSDTTEEMLNDIRNINSFVVANWLPKKKSDRDYSKVLSYKKAVLAPKGFDFLTDINHDRVIPVIYKWSKQFSGKHFNIKQYQKIIELCTAFSCLWRMAFHGGASGIDQQYLIISEKLEKQQDITFAQDMMKERFKEKFRQKVHWLEQVIYSDISKNKKITKFLLALVGLKDLSMYSSSNWGCLPVCDDKNVINRFGNIVLMPKPQEKKFKDNIEKGLPKLLRDNSFSDGIYSDINIDLTRQQIDHRTKRLAEMVWQKLAEDILDYK